MIYNMNLHGYFVVFLRPSVRSHTTQSVEKTALLAEVRYRLKDPRLYEQQGTCKVRLIGGCVQIITN